MDILQIAVFKDISCLPVNIATIVGPRRSILLGSSDQLLNRNFLNLAQNDLQQIIFTMGADCCGGESLPAVQHRLNDLHLNTLSNNGTKAADPKSHEESAKELEAFIKKRIELFEQYNARHIAEV